MDFNFFFLAAKINVFFNPMPHRCPLVNSSLPSTGDSRAHLVSVERCVGSFVVVKQEHVDEVDEDAGRVLRRVHVETAPLEDDHEHQVAKQTQEKDQLGDKLQNNVESLSEVSGST